MAKSWADNKRGSAFQHLPSLRLSCNAQVALQRCPTLCKSAIILYPFFPPFLPGGHFYFGEKGTFLLWVDRGLVWLILRIIYLLTFSRLTGIICYQWFPFRYCKFFTFVKSCCTILRYSGLKCLFCYGYPQSLFIIRD